MALLFLPFTVHLHHSQKTGITPSHKYYFWYQLKEANLVGNGRCTHLQKLHIPRDETTMLTRTYPCNHIQVLNNHTQALKAVPEPS